MTEFNRYQSEIENLFVHWKDKQDQEKKISHRENIFIKDGVVYPENWFSQKIRPMFLLKEAYSGNKDWDLCKEHLLATEKKMSHMWARICQWTEGIYKTTEERIYVYHQNMHEEYYGNEWLKRIAVVNVNKSGGKNKSSMKEINRYAEFDSIELRKEIELCDPTIIICGYTISSLNIIFDNVIKDYKKPDDNWIYNMNINGHNVIVIDYYHPANQYPDLMNYYGLMNIYQLALLRQKNIG